MSPLGGKRIGLVSLVCCGLSVSAAVAQPTQEQQNAIRNNCRSDYMRNCSSVKPGGVEALQCLQQHAAKLSPACQSAVNALTPEAAPQPARAEPAPPPAPTHAPASAAAATPTAAPPPHAAAPTASPQQAVKQSCAGDFSSICGGLEPGGAAAVRCLQRNAARLSPDCARAVVMLDAAKPAAAAAKPVAPAKPVAAKPAPAPVAAAAVPAAPPTAQQQNAIKASCRSDFMSHCSGVSPGGQDALACLQRNSASLSPNCQAAVAAIGGGATATTAAAPAAATPPAPTARPPGPFPLRRAIREKIMQGQ